MKLKTHFYLLSTFIFLILTSCSNNEEKNYTQQEITNNLLVNKQLPISILSNALEWPEEIILGVDLGLIELNEDGKDRLKNILEEYSDDGNDDFIKDNSKKNWSDFVKNNWIKSETTKISILKLNEIKELEFKNNEIIQNKLNHFIPFYIERQTEELSRYQFSFFSKGFWKNLAQISWMHIRSVSGKISNKDVNYLKSNYIKELQLEWQSKFNLYFSPKTAKTEMGNIVSIYQNLNIIKYKYLSKLSNTKFKLNSFTPYNQYKINNNSKIDIQPIVKQFNLTIIDNFGFLFIELLIGLLISTLVNFGINRIIKQEDEIRQNIIMTFFKTGVSPFKVVLGSTAYLGNIFFSYKKKNKIQSLGSTINTVIGVILLVFSFWFISKKQNKLENEIDANFESNFTSYFDNSSINVLDDLNLNTELFFISI